MVHWYGIWLLGSPILGEDIDGWNNFVRKSGMDESFKGTK